MMEAKKMAKSNREKRDKTKLKTNSKTNIEMDFDSNEGDYKSKKLNLIKNGDSNYKLKLNLKKIISYGGKIVKNTTFEERSAESRKKETRTQFLNFFLFP